MNLTSWPAARKEGWLASILDDPLEIEYWTGIFDKLHRGEIDTWDYQWLFTCWCQSGLSVLPNENLVTNIGAGPDALHYKGENGLMEFLPANWTNVWSPQWSSGTKRPTGSRLRNTVAGRQMREERVWYRRMKSKLAVRTRIKNLVRRFIVPGAVRKAVL